MTMIMMICFDIKSIVLQDWVGMVGTFVRSLLSDHKVSSLTLVLPKFEIEYLCDLLFCLSYNSAFPPSRIGK